MKFIKFAIIPILAVGCGVSDSKPLNEIDADLWSKICEAALDGEVEEVITCDEVEITLTPPTIQECVDANDGAYAAAEGCTFGVWRACREYEPSDECDFADVGPDCEALAGCLVGAE